MAGTIGRRPIFAGAAAWMLMGAVTLGAQSDPPPPAPKTTAGPKATAKPAPAPAPAPAPLVVISKDKAGEKGSPFLRPPGTGRYDDREDWRDVPPWRQASFFGIRARGQFFVYVVDCSGSMEDEGRLDRAKGELRRSVFGLREPQRFHVIFYNDLPIAMPGGLPRSADPSSRLTFRAWLDLIEPDGGTDPRAALAQAIGLRPDAVFLLSDGAFPDGTVEAVSARNRRKVPIHCIDLGGGLGGDHLRRIAADSGGQYVSRPTFAP